MSNFDILKNIMEARQPTGTAAYDTTAEVRRIEGDTAWVHIPGGVDETPVQMTINAKAGDTVQVRVGGGSAWLVGNQTAPPTDDTKADAAQTTATAAQESATAAATAAASAIESAATAADAASAAQSSADAAQTSADNANEYAARALGNLSTVQSVAETLTWITEHGTMTLTTDTALDPTHVYFVVDEDGDYTVGSTTYSVVTEPSVDDIGSYYVLSIDESLNNYVGTHLALTSEGLWILPAENNSYKVLVATGNGTTYTTAGTYIIDGSGDAVAKFSSDGVRIGKTDEGNLSLDYHSLILKDKDDNEYVHLSDLRDRDGYATLYETFYGDGVSDEFTVNYLVNSVVSVAINDIETSDYTRAGKVFTFTTPPSNVDVISITYKTNGDIKGYTFGNRQYGSAIGAHSFASGIECIASGTLSHAEGKYSVASGPFSYAEGHQTEATDYYGHAEGNGTHATGMAAHAEGAGNIASGTFSHAEGNQTTASGAEAHAEGRNTIASGADSHAQNRGTIAQRLNQTAIGMYNEADTTGVDGEHYGDYVLIIGNGTADNARSNALTVDWDGNVEIAGSLTEASPPLKWKITNTGSLSFTAGINNKSTDITFPELSGYTRMIYPMVPESSGVAVVGWSINSSTDKITLRCYNVYGSTISANIRLFMIYLKDTLSWS